MMSALTETEEIDVELEASKEAVTILAAVLE